MDYNDQNLTEPPSKRLRLDSAVPNDTTDDSLGDLGSLNKELPADNTFSAQNGFGDQSQDSVTQNQQPSQLLSPSAAMPVLSSAPAPRSAGASLPQLPASASSHSSVTSPTIATGQIGLVPSGQTGQGLIAVSNGQFIQQPMTDSSQIPSSGQPGILQVQLVSSMATVAKQQTPPRSAVLSTPSIVLRLVEPNSSAQVSVTRPTSSSSSLVSAAGSSASSAVAVATRPNVKDVKEYVGKCRNFLSTLIKLAPNQPEETASNVRNLIQGLIDGNVEPEDFTNQLQKELNSSPQPYLVPYLRKTLPFLQQALYYNKMTIDGIRAPPASVAKLGVVSTTAPAQVSVTPPTSSSSSLASTAGRSADFAMGTSIYMNLKENSRKCRNFLSTLIKLASNQPEETVSNVRNLIQGLIDGNVEPEDFTNQLQMELNSSPQPYLAPFLRKTLPFLQTLLYYNKMTIDGIRAPPASVAKLGVKEWKEKLRKRKQQGNDVLVQKMKILRQELHAQQPKSGNCYVKVSREEIFEELEKQRRGEQQGNDVLVQKMKILRQKLHDLQPQWGNCRVIVSRENIFKESRRQIMKLRPKTLRKPLMVKFRGEEGLDHGGVAREWMYLLSHEMLNPDFGLFQYSRDDIYTLQINPDSGINPLHLSYFHFVGRIIGIAIFHGHYLDGGFTMPFYKQLLGKPITLDDLESVDPDLHRSLVWLLNNDITGVIDRGFCVDHEAYGERIVHDLKPGGRDIAVTQRNKKEYVKLYVKWRYMRGIEAQFLALQKGFRKLISQRVLRPFNERELELMISGLRKIDVEDWKKNTRLEHCTLDTNIVKWFWRAVEEFDEERRARLLQFVTGSTHVPLQWFKALQGSTGSQAPSLFTINQVDTNTDSLPKANTCFNRIDIPPYESYEKFLDKLTCAVEETCGFTGE